MAEATRINVAMAKLLKDPVILSTWTNRATKYASSPIRTGAASYKFNSDSNQAALPVCTPGLHRLA
ncbi:MAG: hypothetical protein Q7U63_20740 [Polaromonas sp.]|uniref:hypothetical protein n=1 Tax=Polaromonas sp. TaxID=1869339 RepID=UPI00271D72C3|nr:hypothetical protein [Polaromonas sp.]MDO9116218.1 hypothetical protein [Polaromonas sp.]MDP1887553.1 hypothetical protein [Polaromonas sp.]